MHSEAAVEQLRIGSTDYGECWVYHLHHRPRMMYLRGGQQEVILEVAL